MDENKTLEIRLLGGLSLILDGDVLTGFKSRKAEALLAYLVLAKRPLSRTELAYFFWEESEEEQSRRNLRRTLSDLRQQLAPWITVTRHAIAFNFEAPYWLDVEGVQQGITQVQVCSEGGDVLSRSETAVLQESLAHYQGELLAGVYLAGAQPFEEWIAIERERLRLQVHDALYTLGEHDLHYGRYTDGILQARRLTQLDPLREDGHMLLLRLYVRAGQRNTALKHYTAYRALLAEELGVDPEPAMEAFMDRVRHTAQQVNVPLPMYPNSFVGREAEQFQLDQLLDEVEHPPANRLLTLLGSGGVGKTRLAIETVRQRQMEYAHGVFFVSLAGVATAVQLPTALILALHLSPSNSQTPRQQLLDALRERHMLLVLDNMEHLLPDAVHLLQEVLSAAPRITLLVTSRSRLYLQAEAILTLQGLAYPQLDTAVSPEDDFAALQLLQQRASHHVPLQNEHLQAASCICRLVAGLPLALELAAAALDEHTLQEVATAIQQNLDFLTSKFHDVPERQRSLRAVFQYSWLLLTPQQQAIFAQLSLFAGGFTAEMAQQISRVSVPVLQKLVDKSLILYTQTGSERTDGRYLIHPILRQFALEHLAAADKETAVERIITYFTDWLARQQPVLYGRTPLPALEQMDAEIDNIRQVWSWVLVDGLETAVTQSLASLYRYYHIRSWYEEGVEQFAAAVTAVSSPALRMCLQNRQAQFCHRLGKRDQALELFDETRASFAQTGDDIEEAFACLGLSLIDSERGRYETALSWAEKSLALSQNAQHLSGQADAFGQLGFIQRNKGDFQEAQRCFQAALDLYERIQDGWQLVAAFNNIGMIAGVLGEYEAAQAHFAHTLDLCQQMKDRFGQARALQNLSIVAFIGEEYAAAKEMRLEVLAICQEVGSQWGIASSLHHIGDACRKLGEVESASDYYQRSLPLWRELGDARSEDLTHNSIGNMYLDLAEYDKADVHFQQVIHRAAAAQVTPIVVAALCNQAQVLASRGEYERAVRQLAFSLNHPACESQIKEPTEKFLAELLAKLPEETAVAAQAEGEKLAATEDALAHIISPS